MMIVFALVSLISGSAFADTILRVSGAPAGQLWFALERIGVQTDPAPDAAFMLLSVVECRMGFSVDHREEFWRCVAEQDSGKIQWRASEGKARDLIAALADAGVPEMGAVESTVFSATQVRCGKSLRTTRPQVACDLVVR